MDARIPDLALMHRLAVSAPANPAPSRVGERSAAGRDEVADTARQFEALFVEQILKTMRKASLGDGDALFPGQAGLFREMQDRELVKSASQGAGFGLAPLIERSLRQQQAALEGRSADAAEPLSLQAGPARAFPLEGYARLIPAQTVDRAASAPANPAVAGGRVARSDPAPAQAASVAGAAQTLPALSRVKSAPASASASPEVGGTAATPEAFIERVWPYAQRAAAALGVDPRMLVAQAALETGWGRHMPRAADGSAGHNLFGIKAGRGWQGERSSHLTQEFRDGRMQTERADFRRYDSIEQSFADYVNLLRGSPRYAPALAAAGNNHAYASALQRAGYATDPQYATKLTAIAHGPRLNRALAALSPTPAADNTLLAQNLQASPEGRAARG